MAGIYENILYNIFKEILFMPVHDCLRIRQGGGFLEGCEIQHNPVASVANAELKDGATSGPFSGD